MKLSSLAKILGAACLAAPSILLAVPTQIAQESFEGSGIGFTTSVPQFIEVGQGNLLSDYFSIIPNNGTKVSGNRTLPGADGASIFAAEDCDTPRTAPAAQGPQEVTLTTNSVNIAGKINTQVRLLMAAPGRGNAGPPPTVNLSEYDNADNAPLFINKLKVEASIDGGAFQRVVQFSPNVANTINTTLTFDADGNNVGGDTNPIPTNPTTLDDTFREGIYSIPTGNTVQIRVTLLSDATGELIAFDNIRIFGETAATNPPAIAGVPAGNLIFTEGDSATAIAPALSVADTDSANLTSASVVISQGLSSSEDILSATPSGALLAGNIVYTSGTGTLAITGTASLADYQAVLRSVSYRNSNTTNPSTSVRRVTFTANDGANPSNSPIRDINIVDNIALQSVPFTESFETDGRGTRYSVDGGFSSPPSMFARTASAASGVDGSTAWGVENVDDNPDLTELITFRVAGGGATGELRVAAGGGSVYDNTDFLRVEISADGGPFQNVLAFYSDAAAQGAMRQDTTPADPNNVGDGTVLTSALQTFSFNVPSGNELVVRIRAFTNIVGENILFDRLVINGPPPPTVTGISPTSGTTFGGTIVTISGTNLSGATGVTIGGVAATSLSANTATSITCVTPPRTAGTASVLVTTPAGTNSANTLFTYIAPVVLNCPTNTTTLACQTQAAVNTAFATWLATASGSGGSNGVLTNNNTGAPSACGGSTTVTFTYTSTTAPLTTTCQATFTVASAPTVSLTCPANTTAAAGQSQAAVNTAFATWLASASASGGCNGVLTNNNTGAPSANGGSTTVTFTYTSSCAPTTTTCQAVFTVSSAPPVVLTCPTNTTAAACQTQAAINSAFATWLATASGSGGTNGVLTNNNTGAPAACGGSTTVTFTYTSTTAPLTTTCQATFTVPASPPVVLTCPTNTTAAACQTQAAVNTAFATWLATASATGGCNGVLTNNNTGAPAACGGSTTVTFTYTSSCAPLTTTCQATFTVAASPTVVLTCPTNTTVAACQTQAAVNTAFATWLATASGSGGCNGVLTNNNTGAPAACGGSTTVTFTYTSSCAPTTTTCQATFTVPASPTVVLTCPTNTTAAACQTQAAVNTAFATWLATASGSGGCNGVLTNNNTGAPAACGGSTTVTFTYTSSCAPLTTTCQATFTVQASPTVVLTCPTNTTAASCQSQAAINTAFATWLATASGSGGCNGVLTNNNTGAPSSLGGSTTVTFTYTSSCAPLTTTCQATFTVSAAPTVVLTCPTNTTAAACQSQAAVNTAFATWLASASASGGCNGVLTNNNTGAPSACGGSTTVTFTYTSSTAPLTTTCQATFTVAASPPVVLTCPTNTTAAACQTQAAVNTAFATWLATASASGGCNGVLTNNNTGAPSACGGSTTVTFTYTSTCAPLTTTCQATFTVASAPTVVLTCPTNTVASNVQSQAVVNTAFATWLATASASGGCNGVLTNNNTGAPSFLGGSTTVTFTYTSTCAPNTTTCQATFTVPTLTPTVTAASTNEDTQSASGLVIAANTADNGLTTHYQITGITAGTLFKNDGTTAIASGSFITKAEGAAGLKFTPDLNLNSTATPFFGFTAQAAIGTTAPADLRGTTVSASVNVTPVNDAPTVVPPGIPDQTVIAGASVVVPLPTHFADVELDALTFTVSGNSVPAKASASITGGTNVTINGLANGITDVTIQAADVNMGLVTDTFQVAVGTADPTALQLSTVGTLNRQTGVLEFTVNVTNTTPLPINGFRLHVDYASYLAAHPSLRLQNASSPAGSSDVYVDYPYPVAVDGVIPVRLSFYTSNRTFPNPFAPVLSVEALPTSAVSNTNGSGVQPRFVPRLDGNVLLEFPSIPGRWYRVRYSHDMVNWFESPIPILASNNRTQWIDSGAPLTMSPPSSVPSRFYLVNEINVVPAP